MLSRQSGVPDDGPGGRKETITLKNVQNLNSVQRLVGDKALYELVSLYLVHLLHFIHAKHGGNTYGCRPQTK